MYANDWDIVSSRLYTVISTKLITITILKVLGESQRKVNLICFILDMFWGTIFHTYDVLTVHKTFFPNILANIKIEEDAYKNYIPSYCSQKSDPSVESIIVFTTVVNENFASWKQ